MARFSVGELTATGPPPASADAVMCVDAFQFAAALAELQDEARERLPTAGLVRRVVVTATAPGRSAA